MSTDRGDSPTRGWAASDLSRLLPDGTLQRPTEAVPTQYDTGDLERGSGGAAVVTPLPRPRAVPKKAATSGLQLSLVGRSLVGVALAVAAGFMLYTAWHNVVGW